MENCNIVFDTNAYRTFISHRSEEETRNKITLLTELEKQRNIEAYIYPIVSMELYYHLDDVNNMDSLEFKICKNSIIAQFQHSLVGDRYRQLAISDTNLCSILFNKIPAKTNETERNTIKMSKYVYNNSSPEYFEIYTKNFKIIKKFIEERESEYLKNLSSFYDYYNDNPDLFYKELHSDIAIHTMASILLERSAKLVDIDVNSLDENEKTKKLLLVREFSLTAIIFYINTIKSILHSNKSYNFNDPKKANHLWDFEISFVVGNSIDNKVIILVSDDKRIHTSAKESGLGDRVIKLKDYLDELKFPS